MDVDEVAPGPNVTVRASIAAFPCPEAIRFGLKAVAAAGVLVAAAVAAAVARHATLDPPEAAFALIAQLSDPVLDVV